MNVGNVLSEKGHAVISVEETVMLQQAAAVLDTHGIGAVVVVDHRGKAIAVLSERDIVREVALKGPAALPRPVSNMMTQAFVSAAPGDSLNELMFRMTDRRVRHLPVIDQDELIGIISIGDVVKAKIADAAAETDAIKGYILS